MTPKWHLTLENGQSTFFYSGQTEEKASALYERIFGLKVAEVAPIDAYVSTKPIERERFTLPVI